MGADFPSRKAWLAYRAKGHSWWARYAHRGGTFDRSRNAEKQADHRQSVIERCARRRRESWKLERNNPNQGRPYGKPA